MHSEEQLLNRLNRLKQAYEQMPTISDPEKMINNIEGKNQVRKKTKKIRFLPFGAAAAVLALAVILIVASPNLLQQGVENSSQKTEETAENHVAQDKELKEPVKDSSDTPLIDRPDTITDTIQIEGMPEEMTFHLVKNEKLRISTYYPDDMIAESHDKTIKIVTNFGGTKREDAYIEIFAEDIDKLPDTKRDHFLLSHLDNHVITEKSKDEFTIPYSDQEFTVNKSHIVNYVSIFERNDKMYRITVHYPDEFVDGFGPRTAKIIEELQFH